MKKRKSSQSEITNQNLSKIRKSGNIQNGTPFQNKSPRSKINRDNNKKQGGNKSPFNNAQKLAITKENKVNQPVLKQESDESSSDEEMESIPILREVTGGADSEESSSSESEGTSNKNANDSDESESDEEVDISDLSKSLETSHNNISVKTEDSDSEEENAHILGNVKTENSSDESDDKGSGEDEKIDLNGTGTSSLANTSANESEGKYELTEEEVKRTVYVRNAPKTLGENHLEMFFSKYGKIEKVVRTRYGFMVIFEKQNSVHKALEVNGMEYHGFYLLVTKPLGGIAFKDRNFDNAVFVGCVPKRMWNVNSLYSLFRDCGIADLMVFTHIKQYAYIWFESEAGRELALARNDKFVLGTKLSISKVDADKLTAENPPKKPVKHHLKNKKFSNKR